MIIKVMFLRAVGRELSAVTSATGTQSGESEAAAGALRLVRSTDLFGAATEIGIVHAGEVYRLRITRQGKLILNK
jgi:hemin uptake protein HemP